MSQLRISPRKGALSDERTSMSEKQRRAGDPFAHSNGYLDGEENGAINIIVEDGETQSFSDIPSTPGFTEANYYHLKNYNEKARTPQQSLSGSPSTLTNANDDDTDG
jgi:hypothetical protein